MTQKSLGPSHFTGILTTMVDLALTDITVRYGQNAALDRVSLEIPSGSSLALVGSNGSGKTTLLNVLAGLARPTSGSVSPAPLPRVAYVLQFSGQSRWLPITAGEVLAMGRYPHRSWIQRLNTADHDTLAQAAKRLDVTDLLDQQFGDLSGGQRQRVLVAQAIAQQADVLLLDEPVTGLDIPSQNRILELLEEETARHTTVVITTHNLDEARHCDRVALLAKHLVAIGPPDEVLQADLLRETFGDRVLGQHGDHDHARSLLVVDEHGHDHDHGHDGH